MGITWVGWLGLLASFALLAALTVFTVKRQNRIREEAELERRRQQNARASENLRREAARREFFRTERPRLYINTIQGVTAVLRPADYRAAIDRTKALVLKGEWPAGRTVLAPAPNTIVFVTEIAGAHILAHTGETIRSTKVADFSIALNQMSKQHNIQLIPSPNIFVPWVNQSLVKFEDQLKVMTDCYHAATVQELVDRQAPPELQPLEP